MAKVQSKKQNNHPDKPVRPLNPYAMFNKDHMEGIKKEFPQLKQNELMTVCGKLWKTIDDDKRKPYEDQFKREKA